MPASASARNSLGRDAGRFVRRARDDGAAGGERGADLLGEQIDREIPRREGRDRADRLADHAATAGRRDGRACGHSRAWRPRRTSRTAGPMRALRPSLRPAILPCSWVMVRGDEVDALAQQRRRLVQDRAALLDVGRAPFGPGAVRRRRAPRRGRPWSHRAPRRSGCASTGLTTVCASRPSPAFQTPSMKSLRSVSYPMAAQIGSA